MSVLSRFKGLLLVAVLMLGFCTWNRPSAVYRHIQTLPWYERVPYAERLPLEKRLDLYLEMERRSVSWGLFHKADQDISRAFARRPEQTYRAILKRIREGDNTRYYFYLLDDIDGKSGFSICSQPDRRVIQRYIYRTTSYPDGDGGADVPKFYTC